MLDAVAEKTLTSEHADKSTASGVIHLHQPDRMFSQLVAMSDTRLLRPCSMQLLESVFAGIADFIGIGDRSLEEQAPNASRYAGSSRAQFSERTISTH